jgi:ADP-heptose:LPS heptosyltransferase
MAGILIIKLGALGDIIMACPLIRCIQECHAAEEASLLTVDAFGGFFDRWPGLRVRTFTRHGWRSTWNTLRWIRRHRFARIYDLQSNDKTAILCAFSAARERVGNHPRYPYTIHPSRPWRGETHIHERWREVLASAGLDPGPLSPWLPVSASDREHVAAWLKRKALAGRPFAVMHAGTSAGHAEKRWPGFGALAAAIRAAGTEVVWAGGPDDAVLNHELVAGHGGIDATAAFSLPQVAALGAAARFAVTNDSAPMHALACAGIPVFGLFGPSNWRRNHAIGQEANVICAADSGSVWLPAPMESLPAARVLQRLRDAGMLD